jgi:hypothetical protein
LGPPRNRRSQSSSVGGDAYRGPFGVRLGSDTCRRSAEGRLAVPLSRAALDTQQSPKKWKCPLSNSTRVTSPFVTVRCAISWNVSRNSNTPEGEK